MSKILQNVNQVAVPVGTAAIDETTTRTKARTKACTYLPTKPDPYGIKFYSVVGSQPGTYLHFIIDN